MNSYIAHNQQTNQTARPGFALARRAVSGNAVMLKTKLTKIIYLLIILIVVCHNSFAQEKSLSPKKEIEKGVYDISAQFTNIICKEISIIKATEDIRPTFMDADSRVKLEIKPNKTEKYIINFVYYTGDIIRINLIVKETKEKPSESITFEMQEDCLREIEINKGDTLIIYWYSTGGRRANSFTPRWQLKEIKKAEE